MCWFYIPNHVDKVSVIRPKRFTNGSMTAITKFLKYFLIKYTERINVTRIRNVL